jgi:hypothetical protein
MDFCRNIKLKNEEKSRVSGVEKRFKKTEK